MNPFEKERWINLMAGLCFLMCLTMGVGLLLENL